MENAKTILNERPSFESPSAVEVILGISTTVVMAGLSVLTMMGHVPKLPLAILSVLSFLVWVGFHSNVSDRPQISLFERFLIMFPSIIAIVFVRDGRAENFGLVVAVSLIILVCYGGYFARLWRK